MSFLANYETSHRLKVKICFHAANFLTLLFLTVVLPSGATPHATKSSSGEFGCDLNARFSRGNGGVPPRSGDNGFSVKLEGLPESYQAEKTYTGELQLRHIFISY